MTIEKALKVWHDSVGFNEIECSRALQESITVAFRSLEAWGKLRSEIMAIGNWRNKSEISDNGVKDCLAIIDRHLSEVSE